MSKMVEVIELAIKTFVNAFFSVFSVYQQASDIVESMVARALGIPVILLSLFALLKIIVILIRKLRLY